MAVHREARATAVHREARAMAVHREARATAEASRPPDTEVSNWRAALQIEFSSGTL